MCTTDTEQFPHDDFNGFTCPRRLARAYCSGPAEEQRDAGAASSDGYYIHLPTLLGVAWDSLDAGHPGIVKEGSCVFVPLLSCKLAVDIQYVSDLDLLCPGCCGIIICGPCGPMYI